jgi:hypothetical protein
MPGSTLVLPIVSGRIEADPIRYREIIVDPTGREGQFKWLRDAVEFVNTKASASSPWLVRLLPGTYNEDKYGSLFVFPGYVHFAGAGMGRTIVERTIGMPDPYQNLPGDAVFDLVNPASLTSAGASNVTFSGMTVRHTGVRTTGGSGSTPTAIQASNSRYLRLFDVRAEGTGIGLMNFSKDQIQAFAPLLSEATTMYAVGCQFRATQGDGLYTAQRDVVLDGCICSVDTTGMPTASFMFTVSGGRFWEWTRVFARGTLFHARIAGSATLGTDGSGYESQRVINAALRVDDTASESEATLDGNCTAILDITADVNLPNTGFAAISLGGGQSGGVKSQFFLNGASARYKTITGLTAARLVSGVTTWAVGSGVGVEMFLSDVDCEDLGGTGGTARGDLSIEDREAVGVHKMPDKVYINGGRIKSIVYPIDTPGAAQMVEIGRSENTLNFQSGTATLVAGTKAVTLPKPYPTNVLDYEVLVESPVSEYFNISAKSETGFTINSNVGGSTSTVRWVVRR